MAWSTSLLTLVCSWVTVHIGKVGLLLWADGFDPCLGDDLGCKLLNLCETHFQEVDHLILVGNVQGDLHVTMV